MFNKITLNIKNNIFYDDLNINGKYFIFGKYLQLNYSNNSHIYQLSNDVYKRINTNNNFKNIDDFDFNDIINENKSIIFIVNNIINNQLIYYLSINNFNVIFFDNIKNKNNNKLFQNINIIYYKNNNDLENINNNLLNLDNIKYYFSNIIDFNIENKINLNNENLNFNQLLPLIKLNIEFNELKFDDYRKQINAHKINDTKFIKNSKIPKYYILFG